MLRFRNAGVCGQVSGEAGGSNVIAWADMLKPKSCVYGLSLALMVCGVFCQIGCKKEMSEEAKKVVDEESKPKPEPKPSALPKPGTTQELLNNKRTVDQAFQPTEEDLHRRIEAKLKDCPVEALNEYLKEAVPEAGKEFWKTAEEEAKRPDATPHSIWEKAVAAAEEPADKNGVRIPLELLKCAMK